VECGIEEDSQYRANPKVHPPSRGVSHRTSTIQKRGRKNWTPSRTPASEGKWDFWCSDRQEAIAAMQGLFRDAAERKLVVNLHGCTITARLAAHLAKFFNGRGGAGDRIVLL